jgi:hypothetical protein
VQAGLGGEVVERVDVLLGFRSGRGRGFFVEFTIAIAIVLQAINLLFILAVYHLAGVVLRSGQFGLVDRHPRPHGFAQHPDQRQVAGGPRFAFEKPPATSYVGVFACEPHFGDVLVAFAGLAVLAVVVLVLVAGPRFPVTVVEAFADGYGGVGGVAVVVALLLSLVLLVLFGLARSETLLLRR